MTERDRRLIRVFLSSTFVDFQEERSVLVKQVFPSLRRRAQSRGVEIVDVDLRWGVTEEQTQRGETLPICLAEIDRCRPYFIGLLGERYGWVPPPDFYKPALLERQPWLKEQMGGASVTELEILHGVLRNPEMAGHAFFYFRDSAYAKAKQDSGWVAESAQEQERLAALKEEVRQSGCPVVDGLPDPRSIAERIEADVWDLIASKFPEQEPPDALERENRRHCDYRLARTGLYLGGEQVISKLEGWIAEGEQLIMITGESGAGKSALIANWMDAHQRSAPQDLVYAHHLGSTNDASAIRLLLGRLIETASRLLIANQQITEPLKVPEDWWNMIFKVGEVLALVSVWCQREGRRWILVLDGLDRLAEEDQQAFPWIPTTIPPWIHVVASTLDCKARTVLQEREHVCHEVGPLQISDQNQLIKKYLGRFTKQLESGLEKQILGHRNSSSPLFLLVLLEELRQCAWHDTLAQQIQSYLSTDTIDGLYGKILERIENDGFGEDTRKTLTALWASRAGLSENELLKIANLAPAEWARIDISLQGLLTMINNRITLSHEFMSKAVKTRYLYREDLIQNLHKHLASCFGAEVSAERMAEELPWQLYQSKSIDALKKLILSPVMISSLASHRGHDEIFAYWQLVRDEQDDDLDLEQVLFDNTFASSKTSVVNVEVAQTVKHVGDFFEYSGLGISYLVKLRGICCDLLANSDQASQHLLLKCGLDYARSLFLAGSFEIATTECEKWWRLGTKQNGDEHPLAIEACELLAKIYQASRNYDGAEGYLWRSLLLRKRLLGPFHPSTILLKERLAEIKILREGNYWEAESILINCIAEQESLLGKSHLDTTESLIVLAQLYLSIGETEKARVLILRCNDAREDQFGNWHIESIKPKWQLARYFRYTGNYRYSILTYEACLAGLLETSSYQGNLTRHIAKELALAYGETDCFVESRRLLIRCINGSRRTEGLCSVGTILLMAGLADLYSGNGKQHLNENLFKRYYVQLQQLLDPVDNKLLSSLETISETARCDNDYHESRRVLARFWRISKRNLGEADKVTIRLLILLAKLHLNLRCYRKSELLLLKGLHLQEKQNKVICENLTMTLAYLGMLYDSNAEYDKAIYFLRRCMEVSGRKLPSDNGHMLSIESRLARIYLCKGYSDDAIKLYASICESQVSGIGQYYLSTILSLEGLAASYFLKGELERAETLYRSIIEAEPLSTGSWYPLLLDISCRSGGFFVRIKDYLTAEVIYRKALESLAFLFGANSDKAMNIINELASVMSLQGRYAEAVAFRREWLDWCLKQKDSVLDDDDYELHEALYALASDLNKQGSFCESEIIFREILLQSPPNQIDESCTAGKALGGLTDSLAGMNRLDEALEYGRLSVEYADSFEVPESHYACFRRLALARILWRRNEITNATRELDFLFSILGRIELDEEHYKILDSANNLCSDLSG